ncbi:MAG: NTP transferase domain-containing protein [bacterium]|nr:NTP transferase domain-containing protein [bacterium]
MTEPIGILLAAGLGMRLRPLTLVRPKPLVPLHGIPLLEFGLRQLEQAGCRLAAVNGHHLPELLRRWLEERQLRRPGLRLRFFEEPVLLGVGGGLARMARELPPGPLLVQNGDVLHDGDLARLLESARLDEGGLALATGGRPLVLEVVDGVVRGLRDAARSTHGFTGVHVWSGEARERLAAWREADLIPFLRREIAQDRPPRTLPLAVAGRPGLWVDLGHLARYLDLHHELWENPAYRRLLDRLDLGADWDAARLLSVGRDSRLPETARRCVAWDGVAWEGEAADTVFLDGVRGRGRVKGEIVF